MNVLTLEYTTNRAPTNIDATLAHNNITATTHIVRTYPSKRIEVTTDADPVHVMKICNANAVLAPQGDKHVTKNKGLV